MLCDQALLALAYTESSLVTGDGSFRATAKEILGYLLRDMVTPEGAFISAEDADSPGGEGAYYLWTQEEIAFVLGDEDARSALQVWGLVRYGERGGGILVCRTDPDPGDGTARRIGPIRSRLLRARGKREPPLRDTKILADGNCLAVIALATAYRAFGNGEYLESATRAMQFVLLAMRMPDGGLFHRYRDGEAAIPGFCDDYACAIRALLELYRTTFDPLWLTDAVDLERYLAEHFSDERGGGFFKTADNAERLLLCRKELFDGVVPSANSLALGNLVILSLLTGDARYEKRAWLLARAFAGAAAGFPSAYTAFLSSLDLLVNPVTLVAVTGSGPDGGVPFMVTETWGKFLPSALVIWCDPSDAAKTWLRHDLMPWTGELGSGDGRPTAYVCTGHRCSLPVTGTDRLLAMLGGR
jgi:uncharacterized protein YyaL (SSP411 family)